MNHTPTAIAPTRTPHERSIHIPVTTSLSLTAWITALLCLALFFAAPLVIKHQTPVISFPTEFLFQGLLALYILRNVANLPWAFRKARRTEDRFRPASPDEQLELPLSSSRAAIERWAFQIFILIGTLAVCAMTWNVSGKRDDLRILAALMIFPAWLLVAALRSPRFFVLPTGIRWEQDRETTYFPWASLESATWTPDNPPQLILRAWKSLYPDPESYTVYFAPLSPDQRDKLQHLLTEHIPVNTA